MKLKFELVKALNELRSTMGADLLSSKKIPHIVILLTLLLFLFGDHLDLTRLYLVAYPSLLNSLPVEISSSQIVIRSKTVGLKGTNDFLALCHNLSETSPRNESVDKAINVENHRYSYSLHHQGSISNSNDSLRCEKYFAYHGYFNTRKPINDMEANFSIAFGILIYRKIDQFEQLLRAVYSAQNYYCVHVDDSQPKAFKKAVLGLVNCFGSNVFSVPTPFNVVWGSPTVLRAELECMKMLLLLFPDRWKYYINLVGEEFPLVTNAELVSILSLLNGTNVVADVAHDIYHHPDRFPPVLPAGLQKYKSSTHVVLSRDAVKYIITNQTISHALLHAIAPYSVNDESFFGVLQLNNPNITGFPGAAGTMHGFTRYKLWFQKCLSGKSVRNICIFGVNDLPNLMRKAYGRSLFANKFFWDFQPMAWDCMQEWHHARIAEESRTGRSALNATHFLSRFHLPNN